MKSANNSQQTGGQGLAIASLVLSIISLPASIFGYVALLPAALGIIFGANSLKGRGRKKAIAGLTVGIIGVILSLIMAIFIIPVAYSSLQQSARDTARKNDVSVLTTDVTSLTMENRGQLPNASDLATSILTQITAVTESGTPTTNTAVYKAGVNCDGAASTRAYAITVLLENGSEYCLGS